MALVLALALAVAVAALYAGTASALVVQWAADGDASYGLILAGVAAAVAWRRARHIQIEADSLLSSLGGLALATTGALFYVAGTFAADLFITRASFVPLTAGLIWLIAGRRALRALAAPLAFLLLAIPLPELVVNALTLPLQRVASGFAEATLMTAGVPVFRDGNVLQLPNVTLQIAEACSGLRSAISLASVGALLAWTAGAPPWRTLATIAGALPIAILANGLRIAATGMASETWGPAVARGAWHTAAGWVTFVVSLAALVALHRAVNGRPAPPVARVLAPVQS